MDSATVDDLNTALSECEWRYDIDSSMANIVPLDKKMEFVERAARYFLLVQPMCMIRDFMDGLKTYGVSVVIDH